MGIKTRIVLVMLAFALLTACSSNSAPMEDYSESAVADEPAGWSRDNGHGYDGDLGYGYTSDEYLSDAKGEEAPAAPQLSTTTSQITQSQVRMQIKKAFVDLETSDFSQTSDSLREITTSAGGYIQNYEVRVYDTSQERQLKTGTIVMRIPKENYDDVLSRVRGVARLISVSMNEEDVSAEYYDTLARRTTLESEEERLIAMIDKTKEVGDLLALEQRMSEVRLQIELLDRRAKVIDSEVSMSTITVNLNETTTGEKLIVVPEDFWGKLGSRFLSGANAVANFFTGILVGVSYAFVPLLTICLAGLVVFAIIFAVRKRKMRIKY